MLIQARFLRVDVYWVLQVNHLYSAAVTHMRSNRLSEPASSTGSVDYTWAPKRQIAICHMYW